MGRCPSCGSWDSFNEEGEGPFPLVKPLKEFNGEKVRRLKTGFKNLDEALNGGLVEGQVVLIFGEPGIGKSTLLLQVCDRFSEGEVLYVSGEESKEQVYLRARRLNLKGDFLFLAQTHLESLLETVLEVKPKLLVIDSVQTLHSDRVESSPGSVSQVRECSFRIVEVCKELGTCVFLVGQVNKEGNVAGPKVLEHVVDTLLSFEGERQNFYRVVKVIKNRFGSTGEIGVFKMGERGLEEVPEPSEFFLKERLHQPGSVVYPYTEGSKPLLLEVQSLVLPSLYSSPQRRTYCFDPNRLVMILAILEKRAKVFLRDQDVFLNVVGGVEVREPSADLSVALSVVSAKVDRAIPEDLIAFGELGLGGEVRAVHFCEYRLMEAKRFGFKKAIIPKGCELPEELKEGLEIFKVRHIKEALEVCFEGINS